MLSIGEFSKIAQVTSKTLRYYANIGLLVPSVVNPETKYRYYTIEQLKTLLLINRLKSYNFSLDEIKEILDSGNEEDVLLAAALRKKEEELQKNLQNLTHTLAYLRQDIQTLSQGKSIMSYMEDIGVELVEVETMYLLSIRTCVHEHTIQEAYTACFQKLLHKIEKEHLTISAPPMVLFHNSEFTPEGLDIEFAIPIKEYVTGTRDFHPGLCLKTVVHGPYSELSSIYAKQLEWAEKEGYQNHDALYEVYVNDPSQVIDEQDLITEVYLPIKKIM